MPRPRPSIDQLLIRMAGWRPTRLHSVILSLLLTVAATLGRLGLTPVLGAEAVFTLYILAVFLSTLAAGAPAGALAAVTGGALGFWLFDEPAAALGVDLSGAVALALFWLVSGLLISALSLLRRALNSAAEATAREHLLAGEMAHRTKNLLALVQSVVSQTHRTSADPAEVRGKLDARLSALAAAQDVALAPDQEVRVTRVIDAALGPFSDERFRVAFEDDCELRPETARLLLLALHELATNACKYGALSRQSGCVDLDLLDCGEGLVTLSWTERGGPEVRPPEHHGFGMRLIGSALAVPPESVEIDFAPGGVRCVFKLRGRRVPRGP